MAIDRSLPSRTRGRRRRAAAAWLAGFAVLATPALAPAQQRGITLIIENHYKDDFWDYPEFAQMMAVFCDLVDRGLVNRIGVHRHSFSDALNSVIRSASRFIARK